MYTSTPPRPAVSVFDTTRDFWDPIPLDIPLWEFSRENYDFNFTCLKLRKKALVSLFQKNPQLIGRRLDFVVHENQLMRDPIRTERVIRNRVSLDWIGAKEFHYYGELCGKLQMDTGEIP